MWIFFLKHNLSLFVSLIIKRTLQFAYFSDFCIDNSLPGAMKVCHITKPSPTTATHDQFSKRKWNAILINQHTQIQFARNKKQRFNLRRHQILQRSYISNFGLLESRCWWSIAYWSSMRIAGYPPAFCHYSALFPGGGEIHYCVLSKNATHWPLLECSRTLPWSSSFFY